MDNRQSVSHQGEGRASWPNDAQSEQQLVAYTPSGQDGPSTSYRTQPHSSNRDSEIDGGHVQDTTGCNDQHEMGNDLPTTSRFDDKVHEDLLPAQTERCTDGNHNLSYMGSRGLICTSCGHVELDADQVISSWVDKAYFDSSEEEEEEGKETKNERKVLQKKDSICKMQPTYEELQEILEHLRNRAHIYDRIFGDDLPTTSGSDHKVNEELLAAQTEGCTNGNHKLSYMGSRGLICTSCGHVELDAYQVMSSWVENAYFNISEDVDEEGTETENERKVRQKKGSTYKMQPSEDELREILEYLRSRTHTYAEIFGDESTVPQVDSHSNQDNSDSCSNAMAPVQECHYEIDNLERDLGDSVSTSSISSADRPSNSLDSIEEGVDIVRLDDNSVETVSKGINDTSSCKMAAQEECQEVANFDDGVVVVNDNDAASGGQIRSTRRINTHLSSIYVMDELSEFFGDEYCTPRKKQKVNNDKRVDTGEGSTPVEASEQRRIGTPKQKAAVNSRQKQRMLSEICGTDQRPDNAGGPKVTVVHAQSSKAPRISRKSGGKDDMPYWLKEMTKFMTGAKAKKTKPKRFDMSKFLEESIFRPSSGTMKTGEAEDYPALPRKFRFEDTVVPLTEEEQREAEFAKEVDDLIDELNFNCGVEDIGTVTSREIVQVDEEEEDTQERRCARGLHELTLQDDKGLYCIYCQHVEIHPKDVLPPWVIKARHGPGKKKQSEKGEGLDLTTVSLPVGDTAEGSSRNSGSVWSMMAGVRETMYEHQKEGFEFLWKNLAGSTDIAELKYSNLPGVGGCIISHAPGTGKTRLTITFLETYLKMYPHCLPMIIVPANILCSWEGEFKRWKAGFNFHNLNNTAFIGNERETADQLFDGAKISSRDLEAIRMVKIYSWKKGGGLLGVSYNLFEKLTAEKHLAANAGKGVQRTGAEQNLEVLRSTLLEMPELVILDEGHTPRNHKTKIWTSLVQLKTEKRVILSGTPFQNNFQELFNTLKIVRPTEAEAIMQDRTFAEILHSDKKYKSSRAALLPEAVNRAVERLKVAMSLFVHVHKGTVLQDLPGLKDNLILLKPTGLQKTLIDRLEAERLRKGLPSEFGFSLVSVHPYLTQHCKSQVPTDGIDMQAVEASKLNSGNGVKTKFVLEFVRLSMMLKEKVLIFSQYIPPLELIEEHLTTTFQLNPGKEILRLEGRLQRKQRQKVINAFNDPENDSKILLASIRCCSEGISLVGASRVILLDVVWNPSVEQQAICRAYRIGQTKFVHTYHLMTAGTFEADKYCRQAEKERLSELVFCSSSNEKDISKQQMPEIEDRILEEMVQHAKTKDIFEKIIHQPKSADLIQSLGVRG
ncbi:SNF2 domain-containing protein CLASSY 4-like [Andrographis paniculata]|uniref:SNF2 domain-containing protein CLASSY 4-like n=1 Tax=Andrographis paniculata TaxID=175694 RepID=UPI0021E99A1E|nr:SNF2 domain-containing protein CLASSY 4-like [Andrographis paniculata]XP_051149068.1 SNF2 domain-containing protein CLASSY 4-like [Andrographis paniculata]XP_051149069.1 SNF2 domain-containing protein CLASSY 4-like [Andrographis paniculata]XP_051149070.1 SNF2 domain-containing protein CLASSY 4-like [Andrographis paniculata]XP_051149071.1 SNF2 domain-containing protein CLASSY 4-like [Andrographis paniculata]XP_051149072.1 SNF2 domain-containing protein CLASSY 4-like [Andrographis paniculata]